MKDFKTEIIINATKEKVWSILMDFEKYSQWNPLIQSITGKAEVGETLISDLKLEGKNFRFKPKVLAVEENKEFRWLGHLFFPGLMDGEHYFILEETNVNQVKLIHGERFSGLFSSLAMKLVGVQTQQGFLSMNEALKERAEA